MLLTSSRTRRPKLCKPATEHRLQQCVALKLSQNWSPEQISGWLEQRYPDDERMRISHETIYRSLYIQAYEVLKKELHHLRRPMLSCGGPDGPSCILRALPTAC